MYHESGETRKFLAKHLRNYGDFTSSYIHERIMRCLFELDTEGETRLSAAETSKGVEITLKSSPVRVDGFETAQYSTTIGV